MPATDLERLIIQLEAQSTKLDKALVSIAGNVDKQLGAVERRTTTMTQRIERAFNALAPKLTATGAVVFGGAAIYGLQRFVSNVVDAASALKDTAEAIGISTDALQSFGVMAEKAGVSQEEFNKAITRFSKTLGDAQLKGGPLRKLLMDLGIDITGPVEKSFLQLSDVLASVSNQQQKVDLTTILMGRSSSKLTSFVSQGSQALAAQSEELKRLGLIITEEGINKIDELGDSWTEVKRAFTTTFANVLAEYTDEFSKLADELKSPEFQAGLANFAKTLAEVGNIFAKLSPLLPNVTAGLVAFRALSGFGPQVSIPGAILAGFSVELLKQRQRDRDEEIRFLEGRAKIIADDEKILGASLDERIKKTEQMVALGQTGFMNERVATLERLKAEQLLRREQEIRLRRLKEERDADAKALAAAAANTKTPFAIGQGPTIEELNRQLFEGAPAGGRTLDLTGLLSPSLVKAWQEIVSRSGQAAASAQRDFVKAVNDANVEMLNNTMAVYDAIEKRIESDKNAEIAAIREKLAIELESLRVRREEEIANNSPEAFAEVQAKFDQAILDRRREAQSQIDAIEARAVQNRISNRRAEAEAIFEVEQEIVNARAEAADAYREVLAETTSNTLAQYQVQRRANQERVAEERRVIEDRLAFELRRLDEQQAAEGLTVEQIAQLQQERVDKIALAVAKIAQIEAQGSAQRINIDREEMQARFDIANDLADARIRVTRSQQDLTLELLSGTQQFYQAERDIVQENARLEEEVIRERLRQQLEYYSMLQSKLKETDQAYKDIERNKVIAAAKAEADLAVIQNSTLTRLAQLDEAQTQTKARAVQIADTFRQGLEDIGAAALESSQSFKQAILDMIKQLALLSLRLYILRPLIEQTFGVAGTMGQGANFVSRALGFASGLFGGSAPVAGGVDAFASMGGIDAALASGLAAGGIRGRRGTIPVHRFARGGVGRAGHPQISIHNEGSMNEAFVPLPDGRRIPVDLRTPRVSEGLMSRGPMQFTFRNEINLAGANGDATIAAIARQASVEAYTRAVQTIRAAFPEMLYNTQRDKT